MAGYMVPMGIIFILLLSLHTGSSSGILVGFSYDARSKVSSSHFRVSIDNPRAILQSLCDAHVAVDICINQFEAACRNITSIIISSSNQQNHSPIPSLNSVRSALEAFSFDRNKKILIVSVYKSTEKKLQKVLEFVKDAECYVVVEANIDGKLSLGDDFVHSAIQRGSSAGSGIPIVLSVVNKDSESEVIELTGRVLKSMDKHIESKSKNFEQRRLNSKRDLIFTSSHRELGETKKPTFTSRTTLHDTIPSLTNPATTPITVPSANPTPGIITIPSTDPTNPATTPITVPSTDPATIPPTNPATTPITVPSTDPATIPPTNPATTPITVPSTDPATTPITVPSTNPTTSPVVIPPVAPLTNPTIAPPLGFVNPPATNPIYTYPIPPPTSVLPSITPPATVPGTVPVSPTVSGQSWCVAKPGTLGVALQLALDYACGIGGVDCSVIQTTGSCYSPSDIQSHASYAFNSYYQKNPVPSSCDFGGAATIVSTNPSTATCTYPSSSSASGSGPSVLNASSSGDSGTVFGSDNPANSMSGSLSVYAGWTLLSFVFTTTLITGKIW